MRKRPRLSFRFLIVFCILFAVLIGFLSLIETNLKPVMLTMAEAKVRNVAVNAINRAVIMVISDEIDFTQLVNVTTDSSGKIAMIQANTMKMNDLASKTAVAVQQELSNIEYQELNIPLGTIIGGQLLSGRGPKIKVKVIPVGSATTEFITQFENSGINQTHHKIILVVTTNLRVIVPTGSTSVQVVSQIPVAESVIIGGVPGSYVNVTSPNDLNYMEVPDGESQD